MLSTKIMSSSNSLKNRNTIRATVDYGEGSEGSSSEASHESHDVYFIIPRVVTLMYGPDMENGLLDYRPEQLQDLKKSLEKVGVKVEMKQCLDHVNLARVWFLDEQIFSCKISQLSTSGGNKESDSLCKEAAEALDSFINAVLKGLRESNHPPPEELKRPFCPGLNQS